MFIQAAVAFGLAVTAASGQDHRGQRHERQAPPYYGSTNSTSTATTSTSTSSPTSSSSSSSIPAGTAPSSYSASSSSSSESSPVAYSSSTPISTSSSTSEASPYTPSGSLTLSSTISTHVTVSTALSSSSSSETFFSYSPPTYNASSPGSAPYPTGGPAPSSYGPIPIGPETSSLSVVSTLYASSGISSAASVNATALSPSYYAPSPVGPDTGSPSPISTSYGTSGSGIPWSPNSTFPYSPWATATSYADSSIPWSPNTTFPYQPPGTGSLRANWNPYNTSSSTLQPHCHGATLNVLNASLDWWYTSTFTYAASTFSASTARNSTGWTLIPASTTFNVTTALATPSCTFTVIESVGWDQTFSYYDGTCFRTPTPVAASTSVVSVSAFKPLNQTTGNGTIPNVVTAPPVPSATVPAANPVANTTSAGAYAAGTPFVYFSRYQIVKKHNTTNAWGDVACAEATQTHNMSEPFSFEYEGPHVNGLLAVGANVTGDVNPALLGVVGQETAVAGSWVAAPTVVFVLKKVLAAEPNAVPLAASGSSLETITPTLPPGFSAAAPDGGDGLSSVGVTIRVQSTQPVLLLPTTTTTPTPAQNPGGNNNGGSGQTSAGGGSNNGGGQVGSVTAPFTAVQGGSTVTLGIVVPSTESVVTAVDNNGHTVTATRVTAGAGSGSSQHNGGGGPGNLASIIVSAQQPTNALQVLTQAESQAGNPTAGAIVAGLGGSTSQGGGGGSPAGSESGNDNPGGSESGNGNSGTSGSGSPGSSGDGSPSSPNQNNGGGANSGNGGSSGSSGQGSSNGGGAAPVVLTLGHSTITAQPTPAFVVSGQTILPGHTATIGSETIGVAAGGSAIVVDGSTQPISGNIASSTEFSVGGVQVTALPGPAFILGSQTLSAGGPAVTEDGTTLSLLPQGTAVVVNGVTSQLSSGQTPGAAANIPLLTIGTQTFTANAASQFSLGPSATLTPGGQVIVGGTTVSLEQDGSAVVINGHTQDLDSPAITPAPLLTVGNTVYQANVGSTYDIDGHLLQPGGVITVDGSTISLLPGASAVVINGVTTTLTGSGSAATPNSNLATITAPPVLTVDGQAYAPNGASSYLVQGQVLKPGSAITITNADGSIETISLNAAGNELFTISSGTTYSSIIGTLAAWSSGSPALTINNEVYTAVSYDTGSGPVYVIQGQTLTTGGEIVITAPNGGKETISLDAAGTVVETISAGHTTFSTISGGYGVLPTAAPILTIGGQLFTAINNGASYVIDGKTLTPGDIETVIISGKTYILSLSPQATLLEIEAVGPYGQITATSFETLFPAQATRGTITNTFGQPTAGATLTAAGASATRGGAGSDPSTQGGSSSLTLQLSGAIVAFSTLALAVWL